MNKLLSVDASMEGKKQNREQAVPRCGRARRREANRKLLNVFHSLRSDKKILHCRDTLSQVVSELRKLLKRKSLS